MREEQATPKVEEKRDSSTVEGEVTGRTKQQ
jgi:hypothetical protein